MSIDVVRKRSRKECVDAIKAAVEALRESRTGWAVAEAVCREAAREGGLAEEVWREPLEAAEEERRLADAEAAELAEVHAIRVDDLLPPKAEASLEQTDNKPPERVEVPAVEPKAYVGIVLKAHAKPKAEPEVQAKNLLRALVAPKPEAVPEEAEPEQAKAGSEVEAEFAKEQPKADDPEPVLSKAAPYDIAKEYARRRFFKDGFLATYFHQGEFWAWNACFYERVPGSRISDDMYAFLDAARVRARDDEEKTARFKPRPADVEAVMKCLKAGVGLDANGAMWLGGKPKGMPEAKDVIVFRDGLVDITTGEHSELTPRFWTQSAVDCEYDPEAPCERWERFLEEVFPGDGEAQDFVEEWIGLNMTGETKFQKGAMFVGKPRSGKGTIAWVMEQLAGTSGYVSFSLNTLMRGENSQECLIGRRSGCDPDVRLRPAKSYGSVGYDGGGLEHGLVSLLLKVTGADPITIPRKYIGPWQGVLQMKVTLISNEPPNLNDLALTRRFIKVHFGVCFEEEGRRLDVDLKEKLRAELSGIAVRCLGAYRRLLAEGEFIQPRSGLALARKIFGKTEGHAEFVDACLVVETSAEVQCGAVWKAFVAWCAVKGRPDVEKQTPSPQLLSKKLHELIGRDKIRTMKPHNGLRMFVGLRLKSKVEKGEAWDDEA
jgi:putative DNA primase/helicase